MEIPLCNLRVGSARWLILKKLLARREGTKKQNELIMQILNLISIGIGVIGIGIIVWGTLIALVEFLRLEYTRFKGVNVIVKAEILRYHLGTYLLLGLEFLVAADIIHTITKPDFEELIILGSIVVIRTIISYFLNREIKHSDESH